MGNFLNKKIVLITGGTGSFGRKFIIHLLKKYPVKKIIVFSRDELKQSQMQTEIKDDRIRFFLGDIRELSRLQRAFRGVDIVVHAAALKQVPTLEYNPFEAVKTNILGSQNVIDAAIDQGVKKVLLISTDKAVQPINLYGSTKLCAEKLFIDGNFYTSGKTLFSCVRYGNVIGSRGSVVEILLKSKDNKKVFITDERMTRFWISLEQSFKLVLFALENMVGGEIFVPKIPSMKLVDLFSALAPQAKKEIIGIRAGEKIHEVLLTVDEARHSYELDNHFVILPENEDLFDIPNKFKRIIKQGKKIMPNFCFASDSNKYQLGVNDLGKIVSEFKFY